MQVPDGEDRPQEGAAASPAVPRRIFINYRREDTQYVALALDYALTARFGPDSVFFDRRTLRPGMEWLAEIKEHAKAAGVFIALIGPKWLDTVLDHKYSASRDIVRAELAMALDRQSGMRLIPVLVDEAMPPQAALLPDSIQRLCALHFEQLRQSHFHDDAERLMLEIETMPLPEPAPPEPPPDDAPPAHVAERFQQPHTAAGEPREPGQEDEEHTQRPIAPRPDEDHFWRVCRDLGWDSLVLFVGSGVNAADWKEDSKLIPDASSLAAYLARQFDLGVESVDLAEVAQYARVAVGPPLFDRLNAILTAEDVQPQEVYRHLAQLPKTLGALGSGRKRYPLILTTNYDSALESAFQAADEEYDMLVYMASGEDEGKFVHVPWDGEPSAVTEANRCQLPIDATTLRLDRTIVVKIHGTVDGTKGQYSWHDNYVITEDNYIDYLSGMATNAVVPASILAKVKRHSCLFLGYSMRDWPLRVFLNRVWGGWKLGRKPWPERAGNAWAIERAPDVREKDFWRDRGIDLFAMPLAEYLVELEEYLVGHVEDLKL